MAGRKLTGTWPKRIGATVAITIGAAAGLSMLGGSTAQAQVVSGDLALQPGKTVIANSDIQYKDGASSAVFTIPGLPTGGGLYVGLQNRASGANPFRVDAYVTSVRVWANGRVTVGLSRSDDGDRQRLVDTTAGYTVSGASRLHVETSVTGDTAVAFAVRTWLDGQPKPATWLTTFIDSSPARITTTGSLKSWGYLSSGATKSVTVPFSVQSGITAGPPPVIVHPPVPTPTTTPVKPTPTTAPTTTRPTATATTSPPKPTTPPVTTTAPAPTTTAPAPTTTAPAPTTTAPAPGTTAPAPTTTAPVPGTTAPAPTTTAPAPGTTAPVPGTTAPVPGTASAMKGGPGAADTGVPGGTKLTVHQGDLVITKAGSTYDSLDIQGLVDVQAPNVTITRSVIHGAPTDKMRGVVNVVSDAATNFVLEDSEIQVDYPTNKVDGIDGGNFTLRRVEINGGVDGVHVWKDNVRVESSWIHGMDYYALGSNAGGGPSHNDGIQIMGGTNDRIVGNRIEGAANAAIMVTQGSAATVGLQIKGNYLNQGSCNVNINPTQRSMTPVYTLTDNVFGGVSTIANCPVVIKPGTNLVAGNNVQQATGLAARINVWN